jgi:hypothetical protein
MAPGGPCHHKTHSQTHIDITCTELHNECLHKAGPKKDRGVGVGKEVQRCLHSNAIFKKDYCISLYVWCILVIPFYGPLNSFPHNFYSP